MLFNSFSFLIFFAVALFVSRLRTPWSFRKGFLLLMSYSFYAAWNPPFVALLWTSTVADWFLAKWIHRSDKKAFRRLCLTCSLGINLGLLCFFKYSSFLIYNFKVLSAALGFEIETRAFSVVLPVGISFYTFQTLSYTLDVYRRKSEPCLSLLSYALYVSFFPQLVAGPIVRSTDFLPQCLEPRRADLKQLGWGGLLFIVGLFNKAFIADTITAPVVEKVYRAGVEAGLVAAWGGTLAFAVQIFCDFAGYSTCAIGAALMLGFELPDNFRFPYASIGFSDFWKRWHISLSSWLRDYLYFSLGGNKKGVYKTYRNLMLTMLLGGLWHGASWNFVIWGGLHGCYLVLEKLLKSIFPGASFQHSRIMKAVFILFTFALVCFAWVFFRASDLKTASTIAAGMLGFNGVWSGFGQTFTPFSATSTFGVAAACLIVHALMRDKTLESVVARIPWPLTALAAAFMAATVFLCLFGGDRAFIYFQF